MRRLSKLSSAVAAFLLIATGSMAIAQTANTGSGNGFRISPVRSELTIEKGQSQTVTVTIENPTAESTVAKAIINDFVASDTEDGQARLILDNTAPAPKNSFKKLVEAVGDVPLGPKEKKDISVVVRVPDDANAGGYYGAIRFVPSVVNQNGNIGLTASVGTIVLVRVPGNLTEKLDLLQLSAAQNDKAKSFFTKGNVSVLTRLKNTGDIHVKPFGRVLVKDMFGKTVSTFEFNNVEPRANILPDSTRKFTNDLPKRTWFGRYTVEANLGYSQGGGDLITSKTTFWYIPTVAVYGIIVVLLALVGGGYWFVRKFKNSRRPKHTAK